MGEEFRVQASKVDRVKDLRFKTIPISSCEPSRNEVNCELPVVAGCEWCYKEGPPSYITIRISPITTNYGTYNTSYPNLESNL